MPRSRAILVVIVGVLFNNYVYLHDLITNKHEGVIQLGTRSGIGIVLALVLVAAGLVMLARTPSTPPPS